MDITIQVATIDDVLMVDAHIPEFQQRNTRHILSTRLKDKTSLILIAKVEGIAVAYKIGYALSGNAFYSWLGAVLPSYRQQGIATQLRLYQEAWATQAGYREINVKSMNQFPAMLQLLINSGYQINGYLASKDDEQGTQGKICFTKKLI